MNNDNNFQYTYTAAENQEVQKILSQYAQKAPSGLEMLKALDAKVKGPANTFAYTYGAISAVIMGAGMSLVMTDIGAMVGLADALIPGIVTGIAGLCMALSTYPIYKRMLKRRKQKYAPQILALSEQLMQN